jgi:hypothetical protein
MLKDIIPQLPVIILMLKVKKHLLQVLFHTRKDMIQQLPVIILMQKAIKI